MLRLVVLLVLAAFCAAQEGRSHCCSAEDRNIVQKQWSVLWHDTESSKVKSGFARLILLKLVEKKPEAKALFANVDIDHPQGGAFTAHSVRIINAIDMAINLLDNQEALDSALDHLADQHHARAGVKKEHFAAFAEIFAEALPKILDDYDNMAWKSCFEGFYGKISGKLDA